MALALLLFLSLGCTAKYQTSRPVIVPDRLDPAAAILVSTPSDGNYEEIRYPGSGDSTSHAVVSAFSRYAARVDRLSETMDCPEALERADAGTYKYLACPTIMHWEDRATEWSGKRDRVAIRLQVFEIASGRIIDSVLIEGKSKWATFGGDHPQDLLSDPIDRHVATLY
jgi:hypothetical protein